MNYSMGKRETKMTVRLLRLAQIRADADTQSRARIDETTVAEYAERMSASDPLPAIVVFHQKGLADVHEGTRTDALKFSLASNRGIGTLISFTDTNATCQSQPDSIIRRSTSSFAL